MMDRRAFLTMVGGSIFGAPLAAKAQQTTKVYRVGVLNEGPRSSVIDRMLPPALRTLGWVENENFVFERRHAEGRPDRLPELAADLVRAKPNIILGVGNPETAAAKRATSSIPIVMMFGLQPIETGLVSSLARPEGNVTGMVWVTPEYAGKILEAFRRGLRALGYVGGQTVRMGVRRWGGISGHLWRSCFVCREACWC